VAKPKRVQTGLANMTEWKLNVGCGDVPTGTVNCDLYINDIYGHRTPQGSENHKVINPKTIPNFVVCDASHLPFQDATFKIVFSAQVIEHVNNPYLMMRELLRVAVNKVIIECPHRYGERLQLMTRTDKQWQRKHHKHSLNQGWFAKLTPRGYTCYGETIKEYFFPNEWFRLLHFPTVIRVTIVKVKQ